MAEVRYTAALREMLLDEKYNPEPMPLRIVV
jgi:hypothetical protein